MSHSGRGISVTGKDYTEEDWNAVRLTARRSIVRKSNIGMQKRMNIARIGARGPKYRCAKWR